MAEISERQRFIQELDEEGLMATPCNSSYNERVIEAARMSILSGGREVVIEYEREPSLSFRQYP
jgi:hypothetical protein